MLGQESTPSALEASVQTYIAKFLAGKEQLLAMESNPDSNIVNRAKTLMVTQYQLEGQLPGILATVNNIKAGNYSYLDILNVGDFANKLRKQVSETDKLQSQVISGPQFIPVGSTDTIFGFPKQNIYLFAGLAGIGLTAWYFLGRD